MKYLFSNAKTIVIVLLILIIIFLLYMLVIKPKTTGGSAYKNVKETQSNLVEITQAYVSVMAYSYDSDGNGAEDTAVVQYSPLVNISTTKSIKEVIVANVSVKNSVKGESEFITWPSHYKKGQDSNGYYQPMSTKVDYESVKGNGTSYSFKVVGNPEYTDEIGTTGGYFDFRYTMVGVGESFDSESILNTNGTFSSGNALQYAGLKTGGISSPISFDVIVDFIDGERAVKHFSLSTNFEEIYKQGYSFEYNQDEYVGKKF